MKRKIDGQGDSEEDDKEEEEGERGGAEGGSRCPPTGRERNQPLFIPLSQPVSVNKGISDSLLLTLALHRRGGGEARDQRRKSKRRKKKLIIGNKDKMA